MKIIRLAIVFLLISQQVAAQEFETAFRVTLPDSLTSGKVSWVDLNNDGLLDVVIDALAVSGSNYFVVVKTDSVNAPEIKSVQFVWPHHSYQLIDYDKDNLIDVITMGSQLTDSARVYVNKGDLTFKAQAFHPNSFGLSKFRDLNNDGDVEWIVTTASDSGTYVRILDEVGGKWSYAGASFRIEASDIEILAGNDDGFHDIFVSGRVDQDSIFTGLLLGDGNLNFVPIPIDAWKGDGTITDFNGDGFADVLFSGKDQHDARVMRKMINRGDATFDVTSVDHNYDSTKNFVADFNSNGIPDINHNGFTLLNDTINIIQYDNIAEPLVLADKKFLDQKFGDYEHDGDLDLVQLKMEVDTLRLVYYRNKTTLNLGPTMGTDVFGIAFLGRVFLHWARAGDDSTPSKSITYDLALKNEDGDLLAAEFDFGTMRRLTATAGNNGTENFRLLKQRSPGNFFWMVQAIDNSLHTSGSCTGTCLPCSSAALTQEIVSACEKETLTLQAPNEVLWFSFRGGLIGSSDAQSVYVTKPDTLFYFNPLSQGCGSIKVFIIDVNNQDHIVNMEDIQGCLGKPLQLQVEAGWSVSWSSNLRGNLGSANPLLYIPSANLDTVVARMSNGLGCMLKRVTPINIRTLKIEATPEQVKILRGDYVQLSATGATTYAWSPEADLDNAMSHTPIASPTKTTKYVVTGTDSLGCVASDEVLVIVEGTGFIPNLFTPNGDLVNDVLRIFGVDAVTAFTFKIYNREGNLLFQTNHVAVASTGWDGTYKGVAQPGGVYYWKVSGTLSTGGKILLNGKESGSVVLIR